MYNQQSASPGSSASSLQDISNSWINALTKPYVPVYQQEAARATQNRILINVGIATAVAVLLGILGGLGGNMLGNVLGSLILTPLMFAIQVAVLYVASRALGGTGTLEQQAWVQSTYWVPILMLRAIPIVGGFLYMIGWLYSLYLTYITVQTVHRLQSTQAILAMVLAFV
ncbi:MAG TPA: YIP1 family protein, partial [Chloroflexia bacterium]|nr:YIP1 family protein [Chloroflexia bacterium]